MEIVYQWVISQMEEKPQEGFLTDVVVIVHWRRNAITIVDDKEYVADAFGAYSCPTPSGEDFTPYEDLTREQVIGWLEAGLDMEAIDRNLTAQLDQQINPPLIVLPLPWEPTTTTTTTTEAPITTTTTTTTETPVTTSTTTTEETTLA
jgi:hypothetical protein